ncbi:hypothetical protein DPMN_117539 [Dreissena polymorpha]|uniref:Uncharacterized protein n=1 Tax=Dreissena polymorpha TaxID=45954 RepID=A0A9D4KQ30_DREPO|nr:hypothetical protein DPMN_117539 [Dreissena polymorpha]
MSDVKHRTLSAKDTAVSIETTIDQLDTNLQTTTGNIDTVFDNAVKALEHRRTELRDKSHALAREKKKRLENQLDGINIHINIMEDANELSANIATYGSQTEFLFSKDTIIERLNHLRDEFANSTRYRTTTTISS